MRERAAKPRGEGKGVLGPLLARSREARFAGQIGELARRLSFLGNSNDGRTEVNPAHQNSFQLNKMTLGLVHASYSSPKGQALKLTFFAPYYW